MTEQVPLFFKSWAFFFQDQYWYSPVFQAEFTISQSQGHRGQSACNPQSKWNREVCVEEASQATECYTNFSDTDRAEIGQYAAIIIATCLLVKIEGRAEGGAKTGTAHSQR